MVKKQSRFIVERQAGKLWIPSFIVFGLTRPGIEPRLSVSVAEALSIRPLIGFNDTWTTTACLIVL